MRLSRLFSKPSKAVPAEATFISHKLLHQGGFIRQISAGRYAFLPLGQRVAEKIVRIIDEEMEQLGSQRLETPTLQPIEIWQKTKRDEAFGSEMQLVEDHHGAVFALGATAEGLMTDLIGASQPSYKDLPIIIHQFVRKFRDEKRPRGGLLRVREFLMKDAYSFHANEADLQIWYEKFQQSYHSIAKRLGLNIIPVQADSGALGGDFNHEFMVLSESGEDVIAVCEETGYAANLEKAVSAFEVFEQDPQMKELKEFRHDTAVTCEALAQAMGIEIYETTKTILFKASGQDSSFFVAAMIRGDYDINETKLKKHLAVSSLQLASADEIKELTGAEVGFMGPKGLPEHVQIVADLTCTDRVNFEVGGNETSLHLYNMNYERDIPTPAFADIRLVKEGDRVLDGSGVLAFKKAIEWGHTFHQAQFYAKPHGAVFVSEEGSKQTLWQGAYGIGIERSLATIVETQHDEKGIIWPKEVAPYQVHVLAMEKGKGKMEEEDSLGVSVAAERLYQELAEAGVEVLYDDRDVSAGVKLADMDLIGIPLRIIVSSRSLASGGVEVSDRQGKNTEVVPLTQVAEIVTSFYTLG